MDKKERQNELDRLRKAEEADRKLMQEYWDLPDDEFERVNQHLRNKNP